MAKPLRPKRGTTAKNDAFTGLANEITLDTDKHSIRVHDGVTAGGHEILPKAKNDELYAPSNIDVGVTSVNGNTGDVSPEQTGCLPLSGGDVTGNFTVQGKNVVRSVNGTNADASGNVALEVGSYPTLKTSFSLGSNSATSPSNVTKTVSGLTIGRPVYFALKFSSVSFPSAKGTNSRSITLRLFSGAFSTASITNGFGSGSSAITLGADFTTYFDGSKEALVYAQCLTALPCATSISFGATVKHAVTLEVWQ